MQRESHGISVYITSDHVSTCLPLICGLVVKRAVSKTSWLLHLFWLLQGLAGSSASLSSFLMYAVAASFPLGCCEKLVNPYIKYENIVELIVSIQIQASSLILFSWLFICNSSDPSIRSSSATRFLVYLSLFWTPLYIYFGISLCLSLFLTLTPLDHEKVIVFSFMLSIYFTNFSMYSCMGVCTCTCNRRSLLLWVLCIIIYLPFSFPFLSFLVAGWSQFIFIIVHKT